MTEFDHQLMTPRFGGLLASFRVEAQKSQNQLGKEAGISSSHIAHLEIGDKPPH